MNKTAIIFGAGKTGRGFAAHLAFLGDYEIVLIDRKNSLVDQLKKDLQYEIDVLGCVEKHCIVSISAAYHISDPSWFNCFNKASLVFTAVFGNNLKELGNFLTAAIKERYRSNNPQLLTVITCENFTNAAGYLKSSIETNLDEDEELWLNTKAGFSEAMIFRTCLDPLPGQPQTTVRAQNFFELPCDGDAIQQELNIPGLKPLHQFANQLRRKIYTYNCINAVICYLGAAKGYAQLCDATNDPEIHEIAQQAARETANAQIAEFGFDEAEQQEWTAAAFLKFADKNVPDPIERNAADPQRKLGRDDRLIGPALLAIKHGIYPYGLLKGIQACCSYYDPEKKERVTDRIAANGIDNVLEEVCGLLPGEELFTILKTAFNQSAAYEK